jgi:hypothetical protein
MERLTPGRPRRAKRNPASTQIPFQTPAGLAQQHTPRESSLGLLGGLSVVEPLADTPEAPPWISQYPRKEPRPSSEANHPFPFMCCTRRWYNKGADPDGFQMLACVFYLFVFPYLFPYRLLLFSSY